MSQNISIKKPQKSNRWVAVYSFLGSDEVVVHHLVGNYINKTAVVSSLKNSSMANFNCHKVPLRCYHPGADKEFNLQLAAVKGTSNE